MLSPSNPHGSIGRPGIGGGVHCSAASPLNLISPPPAAAATQVKYEGSQSDTCIIPSQVVLRRHQAMLQSQPLAPLQSQAISQTEPSSAVSLWLGLVWYVPPSHTVAFPPLSGRLLGGDPPCPGPPLCSQATSQKRSWICRVVVIVRIMDSVWSHLSLVRTNSVRLCHM